MEFGKWSVRRSVCGARPNSPISALSFFADTAGCILVSNHTKGAFSMELSFTVTLCYGSGDGGDIAVDVEVTDEE